MEELRRYFDDWEIRTYESGHFRYAGKATIRGRTFAVCAPHTFEVVEALIRKGKQIDEEFRLDKDLPRLEAEEIEDE